MWKKWEFNNWYKSFDLASWLEFEIGKKDRVKGLNLHGEDFEILWLKFKFKKGDVLVIVDEKEITLRWDKNEKIKQVKFKVRRAWGFLKNSNIVWEWEIPKWEITEDAVFEFNWDIFILRFLGISNLEEVLDDTKDKMAKVLEWKKS